MITNRRRFLSGLVGIVAAPAIVRAASIMPVKALPAWQPMTATEVMHRTVERQELLAEWLKGYEQAVFEAFQDATLLGRSAVFIPNDGSMPEAVRVF